MRTKSVSPPWPGVTLHISSIIPQNEERAFLIGKGETGLPDILGWGDRIIVSEKAKAVIQAADDFPHQFYETQFLTDQPRAAAVEGKYYVLHVRRVLKCTDPEPIAREQRRNYPYFLSEREIGRLKCIIDVPAVKSQAARIPLWKIDGCSTWHFVSRDLMHAMKTAALSGLIEYTDDLKPNESLAEI